MLLLIVFKAVLAALTFRWSFYISNWIFRQCVLHITELLQNVSLLSIVQVHVCMCVCARSAADMSSSNNSFLRSASACHGVYVCHCACEAWKLASEVDAGSLSQCYQDHGEAWMLQEAHADVARRGNGLSLPTINNHIQNTSTPHTFLFTRRLFHGLFYYKWPHLELPAAAVMEEARAVDPAGVTSRKKSPWVRHFFVCVNRSWIERGGESL